MILQDLFEADEPEKNETNDSDTPGYQNPSDDQLGAVHRDNSRVPILSLRVINNMKKVMMSKQIESDKRKELMAIMYSAPPGEE
jgi:hypothetical protein